MSISDGSFAGNIYGGYSISGKASSNTVDISGGVFKSGIYGGSGSGQVTDNTVNISGSPNLIEASLFGANKDPGYSANNTLNLYSQITVKEMRYFQNLNFYLPATYSGSGAMLTVNGKAYIDEATVGIEINGASSPLRAGDKITLIKAEELSGTPKKDDRRATGFQGFTLQYEFDISVENGSLFATVTADDPGTGGSGDSGGSEETGGLDNSGDPGDTGNSGDSGNTGDPGDSGVSRDTDDTGRPRTGGKGGVTVTSRSKALSEGLIANVTAINSGGDLLSGAGIMKTPRSVNSESGSYASGVTSFGKSRYNTGSHVDSDTLAVLAGIRFAEIRRGRTAVSCGVFTEAGWSDYDTFSDFANAPDVRGNGESNYFGGGLMLRADYGGNGSGWFYNDAAIRFGRARNSFACDGGMPVNYKTDSPYYGGHIGLGYVRELKNGARLDIGTKLLWTRLEGDSVTLPTKDPITFAKSDSLRARVSARYDAEKFYAGVAYEYEFAGEANATAYGFPIPAPSLKGGTGICELGFTLGKKNAPFSADFNISGFTGKREGFAGGINLNWKF
ncbi:MAG: hypothetical protein LBG12_13630 [Synergistaceae bacterium]|nr:hypothetical protein [Synergistaceae bacterium]